MAVASLTGCGADAPAFPDKTGQVKDELDYPAAPYGVGQDSVIANYDFVGFVNAKVLGTAGMNPIQLADFYNPHAFDASYKPGSPADDDRLFPAGSPYGEGTAKPTVLLIDVASVWCGPCNEEAKSVLPGLHAKYSPCGGQFLLQLADSNTPGKPASPTDLVHWTTKYKVDYPSSIDPSYKMMALAEADAFPVNLIIDTTTMKIVDKIAGVPEAGGPFWDAYEAHLNKSAPGCQVQ